MNRFLPACLILLLAVPVLMAQTAPPATSPDAMVLLPTQVTPVTGADRFRLYVRDTYNAGLFFSSAFPALGQMTSPPRGIDRSWRQGVEGYAKNLGDYVATNVTTNTTRHLAAALLREDVRYRRSANKGFFPRFSHALAAQFVSWDAQGHVRPIFAPSIGAAAGGFVRRAYAPPGFDDTTHAGQRALQQMASLAADNIVREFAPELCRLGRKLHFPGTRNCQ